MSSIQRSELQTLYLMDSCSFEVLLLGTPHHSFATAPYTTSCGTRCNGPTNPCPLIVMSEDEGHSCTTQLQRTFQDSRILFLLELQVCWGFSDRFTQHDARATTLYFAFMWNLVLRSRLAHVRVQCLLDMTQGSVTHLQFSGAHTQKVILPVKCCGKASKDWLPHSKAHQESALRMS